MFAGCDVLVLGKRFDALAPDGSLWELKTDDWTHYNDFLKQTTLRRHIKDAREEWLRATRCGRDFFFAVADQLLFNHLSTHPDMRNIRVAHVPACERSRRSVRR